MAAVPLRPGRTPEEYGRGKDAMSENVLDTDTIHFFDRPEHAGISALAAYWQKKRGERPLPDRRDIVPAEIIKLLPNLHICDVLDAGRDFRFRLFGTALVSFIGMEMTGRCVSEIGKGASIVDNPAGARQRWLDISRRAYKTRGPVFANGHLVNTVRRNVQWHSFSAPMTAGDAGEQMLGALFFIEER
jgi:hypothetical protein